MQTNVVELTRLTFEKTVVGDGIVLVDLWAPWCGPCRFFGPIYEKVAGDNEDIVFGKVNTEVEPELAGALAVQAIPTLMIFRDGILVFREAGALPEAALRELIAQVRALDMEEVRREMTESNSAATAD